MRRIIGALLCWMGRHRWLICILIGHRWGDAYPVADTGEYDCECTNCHMEGSEFDDDANPLVWRWKMLRQKWREFAHVCLCLIGRHVEHDWEDEGLGDDGITCVWCWKSLGKSKHRPADRESGER